MAGPTVSVLERVDCAEGVYILQVKSSLRLNQYSIKVNVYSI